MAYELEGNLLEVCNCNVLCPCWIGEDPDPGTCDAVNAYDIERGQINGVDVSGRTLGFVVHIPGNVLKGNWQVVMVVQDDATPEQQNALIDAFTGKLGGPLADMAQLVGNVISIERAPIVSQVKEGKGTLRIGDLAEAEMEPYRSPAGNVTTLNESIFSTIAGAPAWVSKASSYRRNVSRFGLADLDITDHNAIQGRFRFVS